MMSGKPSLSFWSRTLAPLIVAALLLGAAWRENRSHPLDFWSHGEGYGDYVTICLSHALNLDFWISKSPLHSRRGINVNNTLHPGLPLQATSWAAYRISSLGKGADAVERCQSVFFDASSFWLTIRLVAIAVGAGCSVFLARQAAPLGFCYSLCVGLFYFCYSPAWDFSLRLLGNETFALPLALAVGWAARQCLNPTVGGSNMRWWLVWGSVCALCWLNKLNYIAWTIAVIPAYATYLFMRRPSWREVALQSTIFAAGFASTAWLLATVLLGSDGLGRIVQLHFGVLTHSGSYGNGPEGAVSASAVGEALHSLAEFRVLLALSAGACLLGLWLLLRGLRRSGCASLEAPFLIYLLCAATLFLAAVLKHYGAHYLIAGVPAISLLLLVVGEHLGVKSRIVVSALVGLGLGHSYRHYWGVKVGTYVHATELKASLRKVDELPGRPLDPVLWSYRLPDRRFGLELVQFLAGVPEVASIIDEHFATPDKSYFLWLANVRVGTASIPFEKVSWRYAVFERGNFEFFLKGPQAGAKDYFEQHCRRVIDEKEITVFERQGQ